MKTERLTMAQALVRYLKNQHAGRDGREEPFFGGCFGIFGHGNLAGVGQALQENPDFKYYPFRNEQAMVHAAAGFARMKNRLGAFACTSSIGPGATNMVTGAALATINRLPVLLLPGDIFARRNVAPVLQQLESEQSQDVSVNDCFRPVCRYWDRINRPDQLVWALPEMMRVLTSPAQTGAACLCLPQDAQTEAYDYPAGLFESRVWTVARPRPDRVALQKAADLIRRSRRPVIVAGGGVIYSEAAEALARFATKTGIPVAETQAGRGSLSSEHPQSLGAAGATGTLAANRIAAEADLVIGIGTRYSDFTTASKTAFQNPSVRFVNVNVAEFDAFKQDALPLTADAKVAIEELGGLLGDFRVEADYSARAAGLRDEWNAEVERVCLPRHGALLRQAEVLGALSAFCGPRDVVINAAGSAPGDLHKLWRCRDPKSYHVEYGYSCMGYEIPGGIGVKLAAPDREVYVVVGDGSYLMMSSDLATAVQEGIKITVVLIDNHGFASIGGLSASVGSAGFGTSFRFRSPDGGIGGERLPIDFVANAASLVAHSINTVAFGRRFIPARFVASSVTYQRVCSLLAPREPGDSAPSVRHRIYGLNHLGARANRAATIEELERALKEARAQDRPSVIVVETEREDRVGGYESWWDVPVAEVSRMKSVQEARARYDEARKRQRCLHGEEKK